jgi:histidinol-phosphate/aromatic aminotransferase/cobyric acid decarboxylase-like protein
MFPTFNEYPESIGYDRIVRYIPENGDFAYGADELLQLAEKSDNLLHINPDNPSGNFVPKNELLKLADKLLEMGKTFILDESFVDFSTEGEANTLITQELLDRYPNLVIIKSISKSYGIPGARLGILATSNAEVMASIEREITIWNINSFGDFFLQIFGKYKKDYKVASDKIATERDRFYSQLKEIPYLRPVYSQANYFLIEVVDRFTATQLSEVLIEKFEIYIKDLTGKIGFEDKEYIRVAVRDFDDNEFLIEKLKEI